MTVFFYINTTTQVGDPEHVTVLAKQNAEENWLRKTIKGVAFEYRVTTHSKWPQREVAPRAFKVFDFKLPDGVVGTHPAAPNRGGKNGIVGPIVNRARKIVEPRVGAVSRNLQRC
jgi:hypothetical protein